MSNETTLSIIKPNAVAKNVVGQILERFESAGLMIVACRMQHLSRKKAQGFYAEHRERPFFNDLVAFMTSGPVFVLALTGENAIAVNRNLMGATDPQKADEGTIRKKYGISIDKNSVHGSDSSENAKKEIQFFFKD